MIGLLSKFKRFIFVTIGLIFLGLGIIGYILPGLPGTIWLILSATFFLRSSERLYRLVVQNRFFGRQVGDFLETGQIPAKVKLIAIISIWGFSLVSLIYAPYPLLYFDVPLLLLAVFGTVYIFSRPTKDG